MWRTFLKEYLVAGCHWSLSVMPLTYFKSTSQCFKFSFSYRIQHNSKIQIKLKYGLLWAPLSESFTLLNKILFFTFGTGNFVTDIIHNVTEVDCVILNSGTLRSDTIHPPGKFKMKVHILLVFDYWQKYQVNHLYTMQGLWTLSEKPVDIKPACYVQLLRKKRVHPYWFKFTN